MKIIFNSDLLYADSFIKDKLPRQLKDFICECKKYGHEVVIPETSLLEFNRKQSGFAKGEVNTLINAFEKLNSYGVVINDFEANTLVTPPDLISLITELGINCSLEYPEKSDFSGAHRRACLRESPHPPDIKSDEMRDLVIWEVALKLAKKDDGAILMSRDEVHRHHRGDVEASEHGLIRCISFERAYESLSIETVSAKKIKELLNSVWKEVVDSELSCVSGCQIISVSKPSFEDTLRGDSEVKCCISLQTGDGKKLDAILHMTYYEGIPYQVEFKDVHIDKSRCKDVTLIFNQPDNTNPDINERKASLERLLRGES